MAETTTGKKRTRRGGSRRRGVTCRRDGCNRPRQAAHNGGRMEYCAYPCKVIDTEMSKTRRVCAAIGPGAATGELWASLVEASDALDRYLTADAALREQARSVGITDEQWQAFKEPAPAAQSVSGAAPSPSGVHRGMS
ncbi:hypothetical protein MMAD_21660 [Mycolicibacterium madagascariense]|uniref:Uncharacterized protein n=1 Tax=Mycolicibacterium madagascariense TaxID=212765 RepID=A0A7I7XFA9_9MYCO|nr:hypothetical protein [Mycolicibacterium madagascariense]BBZ27871.1 hypothetical protein MMAD_21660 [Mycolicibacterium madagascariense]